MSIRESGSHNHDRDLNKMQNVTASNWSEENGANLLCMPKYRYTIHPITNCSLELILGIAQSENQSNLTRTHSIKIQW